MPVGASLEPHGREKVENVRLQARTYWHSLNGGIALVYRLVYRLIPQQFIMLLFATHGEECPTWLRNST